MAGGGCREDAILTDQELLHAICCRDLRDDLGDLWVPIAAVTADDEEGILSALGDGLDDRGNEVLGVIGLLEDLDLLAETGAVGDVLAQCS